MKNFAECHHFVFPSSSSSPSIALLFCYSCVWWLLFSIFGQALKLKKFFLQIDNLLLNVAGVVVVIIIVHTVYSSGVIVAKRPFLFPVLGLFVFFSYSIAFK